MTFFPTQNWFVKFYTKRLNSNEELQAKYNDEVHSMNINIKLGYDINRYKNTLAALKIVANQKGYKLKFTDEPL